MRTRVCIGVLFVVLLLAACANQPRAGTSTGCAEPAEGNQLLTNGTAGYCLAYPQDFVVEGTAEDQWISPAPGREANTPPVPALPWVNITVGVTESETVDDAVAAYQAAIDFNLVAEPTTLGGQPALVLDQVPGQELERKLFVVHDGQVYTLTFVPADPNAESFAQMEVLYETVTSSFTFVEG